MEANRHVLNHAPYADQIRAILDEVFNPAVYRFKGPQVPDREPDQRHGAGKKGRRFGDRPTSHQVLGADNHGAGDDHDQRSHQDELHAQVVSPSSATRESSSKREPMMRSARFALTIRMAANASWILEVSVLLVVRARLDRICSRGVNQVTSHRIGSIPASYRPPRIGLNSQITTKLNTTCPIATSGSSKTRSMTLVIIALS